MINEQVDEDNETNEEIDEDIDDQVYNLTTALGMKCRNGIVMASDSQSTSRTDKTKSLDTTKIIQINKYSGMTGSGDAYHVKIVADEAKERFNQKKFSRIELERKLNKMMVDLHKQYNALRSEELGYKEVKDLFHPNCLVGAAHIDNSSSLYLIRNDAWVQPVEDYKIIGSGRYIGNFIMNQQTRFFKLGNMKMSDADVNYGIFLACYIINEVKNFDMQTGGSVNVAVIYNGKFMELPQDKISEFYNNATETISKSMGEMTKNTDVEKVFRAAYPKG